MDNIISVNTSIQYVGMVETIQKVGGRLVDKKQHNAGGEMMSMFFAKTISGNYAKTDLPSYIDLTNDQGESLLSKRVFIQSRQYFNDGGQWQAVFSIYVSRNMLRSSIVELPDVVFLKLYSAATSNSGDDYFAQVQLMNVEVNDSSNLVVNWALGIIPPANISSSSQRDELSIIEEE